MRGLARRAAGGLRGGPGRGRTIGVVGGSGGAGASTFACALGQVGGAHGPTLVVDTDPLGPGLDRVLGLDTVPGVRWGDLASSAGRLGARSLRDAVPRGVDGPGVLTWGPGTVLEPTAAVVRETVAAAQRGHDLVVLDLARRRAAPADELVARCDRLVVVVAATLAGVASTVRLLERLPAGPVAVLAVRGGGLSWDDVERATGLSVLVEVPEQRGLLEAVDLGLGPVRHPRVPLARAARRVLGDVA